VSTVKAAESPTTSQFAFGGQYILVNPDTGSVKNIDLSKPIGSPSLTGNETIDKKLVSSYKSDLNSRISDIIALYKDGQLSLDQASKQVDSIQAQYDKTLKGKKPAKISIKAISSPKLKTNITKSKLGSFKIAKVKQVKLKAIKVKQIKLAKANLKIKLPKYSISSRMA
jgi:hypothetical protein